MNFKFYPYNSFVDQFPLLPAIHCNANFKVLTLFNSRQEKATSELSPLNACLQQLWGQYMVLPRFCEPQVRTKHFSIKHFFIKSVNKSTTVLITKRQLYKILMWLQLVKNICFFEKVSWYKDIFCFWLLPRSTTYTHTKMTCTSLFSKNEKEQTD